MHNRIILYYGELTLKGSNRNIFVKKLRTNVRNKMKSFGVNWEVISVHEQMFIDIPTDYFDWLVLKNWPIIMTDYHNIWPFFCYQCPFKEMQMNKNLLNNVCYLHTHILTDQSSHRTSISWLNICPAMC